MVYLRVNNLVQVTMLLAYMATNCVNGWVVVEVRDWSQRLEQVTDVVLHMQQLNILFAILQHQF